MSAEVWKCARPRCGWEGTPVTKDFGKLGTSPVCGGCGDEDVFPRDDGLWNQPKEERRHHWQDDYEF